MRNALSVRNPRFAARDIARALMYKSCMQHTDIDIKAIAEQIEGIDRALLAARVRVARERRFASAKAASEELAEHYGERAPKSVRAFQSHESGDRKPDLSALTIYAELFGVSLRYFLFGGHDEISDQSVAAEAASIRRRQERFGKMVSAKPINPVKSDTSAAQINHVSIRPQTPSVHNTPVRLIPVLSPSDIQNHIKGRGGRVMSGLSVAVSQALNAGERCYAIEIAEDDLSMVAKGGMSLGPGAHVVVDPDAPILPGKLVCVQLDDDEPMVRIYRAGRAYRPGAPFTLEAYNPAYDALPVTDAAQVRFIHRVISVHFAI